MSFTITTDVFCDSCSQWTNGYTGAKVDKTEAWKCAKYKGWTKKSGQHYCPDCTSKMRGSKPRPRL